MTHHVRALRASLPIRLVLTVWLVYAVHATTNVVRETYLAIAVAERGSLRVDEYVGLHPDLFTIPGRGSYINSNPGASFLGAIPYFVARPAVHAVFVVRPELAAPKPPATYDDPRPNRTRFMNAARARGLDIKLALAALITQFGLMAPLGGAAALLLFSYLRRRDWSERAAMGAALLYAFGTPVFFRSAFLNQNGLLAHGTLAAWVLMTGLSPRPVDAMPPRAHIVLAGVILGYGVVMDYSAVPLVAIFGLWTLALARQSRQSLVGTGAAFAVGAALPIAGLLAYQWAAFGSPWFPAQRYMPATTYSVVGWNGFALPTPQLLVGNLFHPGYGLFVFCPMLVLALAAPWIRRETSVMSDRDLWWALAAVAALYLFSSANQFAALQWNTGVRYLVPAVPLLFLAMVSVLRSAPRAISMPLIVASVLVSLAISMTRENPVEALHLLFTRGPTLPVLLVLEKMASGYPKLQVGHWAGIVALSVSALMIWRLWAATAAHRPAGAAGSP